MSKKSTKPIQKEFSVRNPSKFLYDFSNWQELSGQEFHKYRWAAHHFYYREVKLTDLQAEVYSWMKKSGQYSKKDIESAKKSQYTNTICVLCRLLRSGCPDYNIKEQEYLNTLKSINKMTIKPMTEYIKEAVDEGIKKGKLVIVEQEKPTIEAQVISIQDRMKMQVSDLMGEMEGYIDDFIDGKKIDFNPHKMMISYETPIKPTHAKIIMDTFTPMVNEMTEVLSGKDLELKEAYDHLSKQQQKTLLKMYDSIISGCVLIMDAGKSTRKSRKPRAISKEKLITKLKYKLQDTEYNITSVNPIDIIGCSELWTFNTKSRELTHFMANDLIKTMSIKGTTLTDFNETTSIKKKLRKPEEQLKEFNSSGKVALRTFMENIKTKDSTPNGRINQDMILLKVVI